MRGWEESIQCVRCNVEMKKEKVSMCLGYTEDKKYPNGSVYQEPISVKSVHICPKCGMIELNIKE